jgi:mRNA-degrading endonuclease RelE of RelBE toxin-antitoxin system
VSEQPRRPAAAKITSIPPPLEAAAKVRIGFVRTANDQFLRLPENVRTGLLKKIKTLVLNPNAGKPLVNELHGCCRVTYGRLRCIVRVAEGAAVGLVIVVAPRKKGSKDDAYAMAIEYMTRNRVEAEKILARHIRAFLEEGATVRAPRPDQKSD